MAVMMILSVLLGAPTATADDAAVRAQVTAFAAAGDARDVARLEAVLHPDFRVAFTVKGKPGLTMMDRAAYLGAAKAGKIGGDTRTLTVDRVHIADDLALVQGRLAGARAEFDATWTLVRTEKGWRLLQDAVVFAPRG